MPAWSGWTGIAIGFIALVVAFAYRYADRVRKDNEKTAEALSAERTSANDQRVKKADEQVALSRQEAADTRKALADAVKETALALADAADRKSTRLNSSHM